MNEEWKPIEKVDGRYEISNFGNVRNAKTKKLLTFGTRKLNTKKYVYPKHTVSYMLNGVRVYKGFTVAVEVYNHFSKHPILSDNFQIFHKDNNTLNNRIDNLFVKDHVTKMPSAELIKLYNENIVDVARSCVKSLLRKYGFITYNKFLYEEIDDLIAETYLQTWKHLSNCKPNEKKGFFFYVWYHARFVVFKYFEKREKNKVFRLSEKDYRVLYAI